MLINSLTTTRQIQTNYRTVFDQAKNEGPVMVMTNNKPDVVISSVTEMQYLLERTRESEMRDALRAISSYKRAKKNKKLIKVKSLADFSE